MVFMVLGFGREREREARERGAREREIDKRLRALGHARGHTLGYIGGDDQVARTLIQARPKHAMHLRAAVSPTPLLFYTKSFCRSQLPPKSVNSSFTITNMKIELTDLCGNRLLRND